MGFAFVVCLVATCAALGQNAHPESDAALYCDNPVFDIGERDRNTVAEHVFVVQNKAKSKVRISDVRRSCGCLSVDLSKKDLQPNETAEVAIAVDLRSYYDALKARVLVMYDSVDSGSLELTVVGQVVDLVKVWPPRVVILDAPRDEAQEANIKILAAKGVLPFRILNAGSTSPSIRVSPKELGKSKEHCLTVHTVPPLEVGPTEATIVIKTDLEIRKEIKVPVSVRVPEDIVVTPNMIVLREQEEKGSLATRFVKILPGRVRQFEITGVDPPWPSAKTQVTSLGSSGYWIRLDGIPQSELINDSKLVIYITSEDIGRIEVPIVVTDQSIHSGATMNSMRERE